MSYELLTDDDEFHQAVTSTRNLRDALREGISRRKFTIQLIKDLKKEVEISYDKSKKATIGGTVATVTGSALGIAGFVTGFFTFGAGFGLAIAGGALAAAGGATIAGSQIGYHVVSSTTCKDAQKAVDRDTEQAAKIEQHGAELNRLMKALEKRHKESNGRLFNRIKHYIQHGTLPKSAASLGYNLVRGGDIAGDGIRTGIRAVSAGRGAAAGVRLTATGLKTATGILRVGSVALDIIFIPIDLGVMIKASYDVHKYRTTGESNSNAAASIGVMIQNLEENLKNMEEIANELESQV